jgi:hypothetical protein
MRRLVRHLFTLTCITSLLLCIATIALWVRSYRVGDAIVHGSRHDAPDGSRFVLFNSGVFSNRGILGWAHYRLDLTGPMASWWADVMSSSNALTAGWQRTRSAPGSFKGLAAAPQLSRFGFIYDRQRNENEMSLGEVRPQPHKSPNATYGATDQIHIAVPIWTAVLATGALPTLYFAGLRRRLRRRRLVREGRCPTCGYDLRATPDACPECGSVATVRRP